ncbi:LysR family transcriptional regulator [Duganella sp. Leaf126]|uniref:LysR family transcriptional regulator n=1 Tax=Duganella sp. Leaf126 TaxID=1736266 RepID=UPI0006F25FE6|nr:LysR family transcriptional regulator [Duganella sp. Leaf126]KQQ40088.1 LysR family transcriptional regulator [Duganella sp. Leaf126]
MDLAAVTDFNLVARHGGFGAASRVAATPKATLSRRVRELEESLGVRLIERGVRPLRLTDEGAALYARTEEPFGAIADTLRDIRAGLNRPSGLLRISAPLLFANMSLGPLAAAFLAAYPEVLLEVTTDDGFVDLRDGTVDVVIRANPRPDDDLVGRCFLTNPLVLVAPPGLARPAEIHQPFPAVMRTGMVDGETWTIVDAIDGAIRPYRPQAVLRLSSPLSIRDAVVAGAGAAMVPVAIVADELAAGRLVQWGACTRPPVEVWVLHASRRLVSTKVRVFVSFICDYFAKRTQLD